MRICFLRNFFVSRFPISIILSSLIVFLFILLYPENVYSIDIILAWNADNVEEDFAGFKIFCREEGQEYNYDNPAWEGNVTTCTIYNKKEDTTYYFVARTFSTKEAESINSNEVQYLPTINLPPISNAGPDETIDEGDKIILDGSDSNDPDGNIISYNWTQLTGISVELVNSTSVQASFIAPDVEPGGELLTFRLTVTDDGGLQSTDTCAVNVSWVNYPPVAEAGPDQTVDKGTRVSLDGSKSNDPDGSIGSYHWEQKSGVTVMLSDPMSVQTTFTVPDVGSDGESLTFQLTVTDNGGLQSTDICTIYVAQAEELPALTGLSISGETELNENSLSDYIAMATFRDGSIRIVTEIVTWSEDSLYADINSKGELSTSDVTSNKTVTITAMFNLNGMIKKAEIVVMIIGAAEPMPIPFKPVVTSPLDGQTDCELMLHLTTLPFSDPNSSSHSQSQWQISKKDDFSALILDITSNEYLTELTVPGLVLESETTYYIRVRFFDSYFEPSDWSDLIEFTTNSDINDADDNGIPDDQEISFDIDLNRDNIADNDQTDMIRSVRIIDSDDIIAISKESDSIVSIEAMKVIDPSTILEETRKPKRILLGLFSYRVRVNETGITIFSKIYFSRDIHRSRSFYKYDTVHGWEDYSQYVDFDYKTNSIIIELKDGGNGDNDGVANGIIIGSGVLVEDDSEINSIDDFSSSFDNRYTGGGCFIEITDFGL